MADLPCAGRRVILALTVRKFVCPTPTCPRQIFTERLPDLVQSYARMTNRLREALVTLGILKNLRQGLKELMARKQKVLPEVEEDSADGIPLRAQGERPERGLADAPKPDEPEKHWRSMSPGPRHFPESCADAEDAPSPSQVSRANRYARYEAVRALHQQAFSQREIARHLKLSRNTVRSTA